MKRILSLLVCTALLFAFVACDNQASVKAPNNAIIGNAVELNYEPVIQESELVAAIQNPEIEAVILEGSVALTGNLLIGGEREFFIDLNGNSIFCNDSYISVKDSSKLTIKDSSRRGEVLSEVNYAIRVTDGACLTLDGGTISGATYGLCVFNEASLVVNDGLVTGDYIAISSNNFFVDANGKKDITKKSKVNIEINGGEVNGVVGIFYPSLGSLKINKGAQIIGIDAVVAKGGDIYIDENATISSFSKKTDYDASDINWNNGWEANIGADVILVSNSAYAEATNTIPFSNIDIKGTRKIVVAYKKVYDDENNPLSFPLLTNYVKSDSSNFVTLD